MTETIPTLVAIAGKDLARETQNANISDRLYYVPFFTAYSPMPTREVITRTIKEYPENFGEDLKHYQPASNGFGARELSYGWR